MRKSRLFTLIALLFVNVLAFNGVVFGWGTTGGDGKDAYALQETAVFFNNASTIMTAGDVVVLDLSGTGVSAGTTLGSYVTTTTTADNHLAVGIVKSTSPDQTPVVVVTKGPAIAKVADATDHAIAGSEVGTTTIASHIGGVVEDTTKYFYGSVGMALEDGDTTDPDTIWIWVDPENH